MSEQHRTSYLSPKLVLRQCPGTPLLGLFARQPIALGEILAVWGGRVVTTAELFELSQQDRDFSVQVEDDLHLAPAEIRDAADYFNHSCEPNAGMQGQIVLIAMRPIAVDEEVCYDYAMTDADSEFSFPCSCAKPRCRRQVTSDDWRTPELQTKYRGYFSPYLQRRIEAFTERKNAAAL